MAISDTIDDGGEEWEGGPIEMGPLKRDAAPDNVERLDQELFDLEANEPQPGDNTPQIDDPGIPPFPGEELLNEEVAELEADEPFDFTKSAGEPAEAPEVGEVDTADYTPPETAGEYLASLSKDESTPSEKPLSARQQRGASRVPSSNPPAGEKEELGSLDEGSASDTLEDADIRNRDTAAKQSIDHMRRIEEITERMIAMRT